MAKIKMTVLYKGKAGNASEMAEAIGRSQQAKIDQIPPAYTWKIKSWWSSAWKAAKKRIPT